MALMGNLPLDILTCIFEESSPLSLVELSTVNKRFHALSSRQIYKTIKWRWEKNITPPILLLLRTIISRPELGSYIQHVNLQGSRNYEFSTRGPPKIPMDSISSLELSNVMTAVEQIQTEVRMPHVKNDLLVKEFRAGTMDALVTVLLVLLPNLRFLRLNETFTEEARLLGAVSKALLCAPNKTRNQSQTERILLSPFRLLQEVYFRSVVYSQHSRGHDQDIVFLPFFYATQIERITVTLEDPGFFDCLSWEDEGDRTKPMPILPPTVTMLRYLKLNCISEKNLGKLLAQCPNLESLHWSFAGSPYRTEPSPFLDCGELGKALEHVKETLTSLVLSASYIYGPRRALDDTEDHGILSNISTLQTFPRLSKLEIPFIFLLGHSCNRLRGLRGILPRALKELTLKDDSIYDGKWPGKAFRDRTLDWGENSLFAITEEWLEGWKESAPDLENLVLIFRQIDEELWPAVKEKSRRLEERYGIKVEAVRFEWNS